MLSRSNICDQAVVAKKFIFRYLSVPSTNGLPEIFLNKQKDNSDNLSGGINF
jgi:hypothetical protein